MFPRVLFITPMVSMLAQTVSSEVSSALSTEERVRLRQLETVVEKNLDGMLAAGKALSEIRSSRLYRQYFATFEEYVRERWALSRSRADELIRSNATAELLSASGVELPSSISEAALRPVSALPSPELQIQAWRVVQAASPAGGPTQPVAAKVVRTIRNAIEAPGEHTGRRPRGRGHPPREQSFIAPVRRLAAYPGFDANLATSHLDKFSSALSAFTAFRIMADRCLTCCDILSKKFPELTDG